MSVDVYLVAQVEWANLAAGPPTVAASNNFKIGYSANPFNRLAQLRVGASKNLEVFGVVVCSDEPSASKVEKECHTLLQDFRGRGEWFNVDIRLAWSRIERSFPKTAVWLTDFFTVDLDTMRLVPFKVGAFGGLSDNYHTYRAHKESGTPLAVRPGPRF